MEDNDNVLVLEFKCLLFEHFKKERSVQFYAHQLNVTEERLNQAITSTLNLTAKNAIDRKVMSEAKWKLVYTSDSIQKISQDLGFNEVGSFCEFFQQKEGLQPMQFRVKYKTTEITFSLAN